MRRLPRFVVGADPVRYDFSATVALVAEFGPAISNTYERLRALTFSFPTMEALHRDAVDRELLFRQTLPLSGVATTLGVERSVVEDYMVTYVLGQTSILNHIDRHLDISASYTIRDPELLLGDVHSTMCYAVCCLYRMIRDMKTTENGARSLAIVAATSLEIIQSMHDNYARRFNTDSLESGIEIVSWYRESNRSPHLGSGFYSSSILGLFAYLGRQHPEHLPLVLGHMRRLRQRVDEIADLFEDIATGLVSYPVAMALAEPTTRADVSRLTRMMWQRSRQLIQEYRSVGWTHRALANDEHLRKIYAEFLRVITLSGTLDECYREAHELWQDIESTLSSNKSEPHLSMVLMTIADLKRAFLDRLKLNDWQDRAPPHSFDDILQAARIGEFGGRDQQRG